ncbi:MAG TPA: AI-2E family transporter, partial [Candidatus Eremiobacteraceae bacterium]|nr:AI-2E family transporter [Candidatus Eremiobacteraceae bacterium]
MIDPQPAVPTTWRALVRPVVLILVAVAAVALLRRIPMTIEVFIVATFIAYGINPLIRAMSKRMPRALVIVLVYASFLVLLLVGAVIVIPTAIDQLQSLYNNSGDYLAAAQAFVDKQEVWINKRFGGHMLPPQLKNVEDAAVSRLSDFLQSAISGVGGLVVWVIGAVVIGVTGIILSYYFLVNAYAIRETFLGLFPERSQPNAKFFAAEVGRVFGGFVGGQIILCAFSGLFTFFGLELIGSAYAVLLGILTGLLYAIPYLGIFAAVVIGVLLGLLQGWQVAVWTAVIIIVVTKFADMVLVPKVMSESVGVSPVGIILSYYFLVNAYAIRETFLGLFPERSQPNAKFFASEVGRVFGG